MPDELALIDEILNTEKKEQSFSPIQVEDSVKTVEQSPIIAKNTNGVPKEIEQNTLNSISLNQEVAKSIDKNNAITNPKNNVQKAIDSNSTPLSQEVRKEQAMNLNLLKSVDGKEVRLNSGEERKAALDGEKVKRESKKTFSEQINNNEGNKFLYHTVRRDETLFRISVNYNVSVENLWKMNNLSSTIVEAGTVLKIKLFK